MPYSPFRVNSPSFAPIVLFFFVFFTSPFARAQQWSTPDASGNMHNTNTGTVNINAATSGFSLDVNGWSHVNGMFVTDAPQAGNISTWVRGYANANLVLNGGTDPVSPLEAYWITT